MSTAITVVAPAATAASRPERPTAPVPKSTKLEPGVGLSTLSTAPAPVRTPQPSGPRMSSGAVSDTFTTLRAATFVTPAKEDCPKKWEETAEPSSARKAVLRSGRAPPKLRMAKSVQ